MIFAPEAFSRRKGVEIELYRSNIAFQCSVILDVCEPPLLSPSVPQHVEIFEAKRVIAMNKLTCGLSEKKSRLMEAI